MEFIGMLLAVFVAGSFASVLMDRLGLTDEGPEFDDPDHDDRRHW